MKNTLHEQSLDLVRDARMVLATMVRDHLSQGSDHLRMSKEVLGRIQAAIRLLDRAAGEP